MQVQIVHLDSDYQFKKNPNQILSIGPEFKNLLGRPEFNKDKGVIEIKEEKFDRVEQGGLACVTYEMPKALTKDAKVDIRTIMPYTNECFDGSILLVRFPKNILEKIKKDPNHIEPNLVKKEWTHPVKPDYKPTKNEFFAFVADGTTEDKDDHTYKHKYIKLEPVNISGRIDSIDEAFMRDMAVNYHIYRQVYHTDGERYFIHTPQLAAMKQAYGGNGAYHPGQVIGKFFDKYYADFLRVVVDSGRQFQERYGFNPASIILHDRPSFAYAFEMIRRSAEGDRFEDGKIVHSIMHNPGRDYQGWLGHIESFLRIAFDKADYTMLKSHPQYYSLKRLLSIPKEKVTTKERAIIEAFFLPYFKSMVDELGTTNQTMIAVAATKMNPKNSSIGTVSKTYGYEMITLKDIAKGLTAPLFSIKDKIINVTNGNLPASLNIDNTNATFGNGDNGISREHKMEYIPFRPEFKAEDNSVTNYDKPHIEVLKEEIEKYDNSDDKISKETKTYLNEYIKAKELLNSDMLSKSLYGEIISKKEKEDAKKIIDTYKEKMDKLPENEKKHAETYIKYKQVLISFEKANEIYDDVKNKFLNEKKIKDDYVEFGKIFKNVKKEEKLKVTDFIKLANMEKIENKKFKDFNNPLKNKLEKISIKDFVEFLQDKDIEAEKKESEDKKKTIQVTYAELEEELKNKEDISEEAYKTAREKIIDKKFDALFKKLSGDKLIKKYKDTEMSIKDLNDLIGEIGKKYNKVEKEYTKVADEMNLNGLSIKDAKTKNKEWILDLLTKQYNPDSMAETKANLEKLFFSDDQLAKKNYEVHGYIKSSGDGKDKIFANWGRPDTQKGFSTFLQGFYKFLSMKTPPKGMTAEQLEDIKQHAKLLFGSGSDKWDKNAPEFKLILEYINKIQKLDGGKYAGNVCYVNGFFPNRIIACSDFGFFTSRFEPCGITPLESYAAGTPVASIRTGGAPDFVVSTKTNGKNDNTDFVFDVNECNKDEATGFLTEHSFMRNDTDLKDYIDTEKIKKEILGDEPKWTESMEKEYGEYLDEARREVASNEVADMFVRCMNAANNEKLYDQLSKNCFKQLIQWAKNNKYNRDYNEFGEKNDVPEEELKSAEDIYLEDIFGVSGLSADDKSRTFLDSKPRSTEPMKKLTAD